MTIYIIALIVVVIGGALILGRASKRKDDTMRDVIRRRAQDYDRERLMGDKFDDTTRLYDDTTGPK